MRIVDRAGLGPARLAELREQTADHTTLERVVRWGLMRGHLIADLDPLRWREPHMHHELDPLTYGLTIWDLDREYLTGGLAGQDRMTLGNILKVLRDAYCRTLGIEYMHIQEPEQKAWIQEQVEGVAVEHVDDLKFIRHLHGRSAFIGIHGHHMLSQPL